MITDDLRTRAKLIASGMNLAGNALEQKIRTRKAKEEAASAVWSGMNYREKHMRGWFGGDRRKIRRYENLKIDILTLSEQIEHLEWERANYSNLINLMIHAELMKTDSIFQNLMEAYSQSSDMKYALDKFTTSLHSAIEEADGAYSPEYVDLLSSNSNVSLLSFMENDRSNEAICAMARMVRGFQVAINDYGVFVRQYVAPDLSETNGLALDLILDLDLDEFDFIGFLSQAKLDEADSVLRETLTRLEGLDDIVTNNLRSSEGATKEYSRKARELALQ